MLRAPLNSETRPHTTQGLPTGRLRATHLTPLNHTKDRRHRARQQIPLLGGFRVFA